jgi:hypothetical protein
VTRDVGADVGKPCAHRSGGAVCGVLACYVNVSPWFVVFRHDISVKFREKSDVYVKRATFT